VSGWCLCGSGSVRKHPHPADHRSTRPRVTAADQDDTLPGWPVVGYADIRLQDHPDLRFVAVTDGRRCSVIVIALDDLIACGSLRWLIAKDDDAAGMIGWVEVLPRYQRRGIATALLTVADEYSDRYGLPRPRHADRRTPSGDAWAQSLGAEPAREPFTPRTRPSRGPRKARVGGLDKYWRWLGVTSRAELGAALASGAQTR
jgi:GNAT superfamily N-acetyltransferase